MEKNLARRPGFDVVEQMNSYQQDVKKKSKQMKAMASELNMHQAQVSRFVPRRFGSLNYFELGRSLMTFVCFDR